MHRKKSATFILFFLVVPLLCSCATVKPVQPEINLMRLWVKEATLSHVNLQADLRLFNPNEFSLDVEEVTYSLALNGIPISEGKSLQEVEVASNSYGNVSLRLSSAYLDMISFLNKMQTQSAIRYTLHGTLKVRAGGWLSHSFSFEREGLIPLEQRGQ